MLGCKITPPKNQKFQNEKAWEQHSRSIAKSQELYPRSSYIQSSLASFFSSEHRCHAERTGQGTSLDTSILSMPPLIAALVGGALLVL